MKLISLLYIKFLHYYFRWTWVVRCVMRWGWEIGVAVEHPDILGVKFFLCIGGFYSVNWESTFLTF